METNNSTEIKAETLVARSLCKLRYFVRTVRCLTVVNARHTVRYGSSKELYSCLLIIVRSHDNTSLARGGISFRSSEITINRQIVLTSDYSPCTICNSVQSSLIACGKFRNKIFKKSLFNCVHCSAVVKNERI